MEGIFFICYILDISVCAAKWCKLYFKWTDMSCLENICQPGFLWTKVYLFYPSYQSLPRKPAISYMVTGHSGNSWEKYISHTQYILKEMPITETTVRESLIGYCLMNWLHIGTLVQLERYIVGSWNSSLWKTRSYIDGLVQERCNSSGLAVELCLSCTNPSIYPAWLSMAW